MDHAGGRTSLNASADGTDGWTDQGNRTQATFEDLVLVDGDSVRFWVQARDLVGRTAADSLLIHVDSSPPVIELADDLAVPSADDLGEMRYLRSLC